MSMQQFHWASSVSSPLGLHNDHMTENYKYLVFSQPLKGHNFPWAQGICELNVTAQQKRK